MYESDPRAVDRVKLRKLFLQDDPPLSNVEIAKIIGHDRKTVGRWRGEWKEEVPQSPLRRVVTSLPDDEVFERLHNQRVPVVRQARILGLPLRRVHRARYRLNLKYKDQVVAYPQEMHDAVDAMLADGSSFAEIQRTLKVSQHFLRDHWPGQGWTPQQGMAHRRALREAREAGIDL